MRFDLRAGLPDTSLFPRRAWNAATADAVRRLPDAAFQYGSERGEHHLRRAIASYLGRTRAISVAEDQTFITCGSSHSFSLLWNMLRAAGVRRVAHEDPGWDKIAKTIAQAGLQPVPVRVNGRGLSMTDLRQADVQAVVVSPAHQYPTGVVMHPARRAELIRWARQTGGLIVEDDYDAEYRFGASPIPPLRSVGADCVAYLGTTSKILAPALRLGWLIVPEHLAPRLAAEHEASYAQPAITNQTAFATLLEGGVIDRHLRRTRHIYKARRTALLSAINDSIPGLPVRGGGSGLHVLAWLPPSIDEVALIAEAANRGVAIEGVRTGCTVNRKLRPGLVLGYGAITESAIPEAISRLAQSLEGMTSAHEQYDTASFAA